MQLRDNGNAVGYQCRGHRGNTGDCVGFGAVRVEVALARPCWRHCSRLGVEEARQERGEAATAEEQLASSSAVETRYRAERAQAQFVAVEPGNHNAVQVRSANRSSCCSLMRFSSTVSQCPTVAPRTGDSRPSRNPTGAGVSSWKARRERWAAAIRHWGTAATGSPRRMAVRAARSARAFRRGARGGSLPESCTRRFGTL